jgi:hypothetical protein
MKSSVEFIAADVTTANRVAVAPVVEQTSTDCPLWKVQVFQLVDRNGREVETAIYLSLRAVTLHT